MKGFARVMALIGALAMAIALPMAALEWFGTHVALAVAIVAGVLFADAGRRWAPRFLKGRKSTRTRYDLLTGLLDRTTFEHRVRGWTTDGAHPGFAMLVVNLDRFKVVNETYGHATGDALLVDVARLLQGSVRDRDLVARIGADEFVIALHGVKEMADAGTVASKFVRLLSAPFEVNGNVIHVSASVGIALFPRDGADVEGLVGSAAAAMQSVKTGGKNSFHFTDDGIRSQQVRQLRLERQLRLALRGDEIEVVYQPQVALASGRVVGFEALMRWHNEELGIVSPSEFIPVAEEVGLIATLGEWLMREACRQVHRWTLEGHTGLTMAVNVSSVQIRQPDFLRRVADALHDAEVAPDQIEIEVTEGVLIEDFERAVAIVERLHRLGVRTALDDFGTGYSSLAYLHRLPVDSLKIDRSFISGVEIEGIGAAGAVPIIDAITTLGKQLGKVVVAEGVETLAQAGYLRDRGVSRAQGYLFAKPLTAEDASRLLQSGAASSAPQVESKLRLRQGPPPATRLAGPLRAPLLLEIDDGILVRD